MSLGEFLERFNLMIKLKVQEYQNYITPSEWIKLLGKPLKEGSLSLDDWEFVSEGIETYLAKGKPSNFNIVGYIHKVKTHRPDDKGLKGGIGKNVPLYITSEDTDTEIENPEIYKHHSPSALEDALIENMCIDSAFAELQTINREIMIKHHVNLIKLLRRCLSFPNEKSEEFITLKGLVKELDDTQREQVAIILSSGQGFERPTND